MVGLQENFGNLLKFPKLIITSTGVMENINIKLNKVFSYSSRPVTTS